MIIAKRDPSPPVSSTAVAKSSPMIVCTSASSSSSSTTLRPFLSRPLCVDRKGLLDHFRSRPMIISTIRVGLVTSSTIFTNFMTDQLELESHRLDLVQKGLMKADDAQAENEEWETREWKIRWEAFPQKFWHGLLKFHSITLCMRLYEYVASKIVSDVTLDKLTKDTFRDAKYHSKAPRALSESFRVNLWANATSFMADCTVHQVIFVYGYYVYYLHHKHQPTKTLTSNNNHNKNNSNHDNDDDDTSGGIALSLILKNTKLAVTRSIALVAASAGGALGTLVYPGWGTLLGTQFGDSAISSLTD